jgi:hypothetical protein
MLYIALVRSQLEYACVVWNSITNTDSNKFEHLERTFAAPCHNRFFFQDVSYHYNIINILDKLNMQTLHVRWRHIDTLFLINIFRGTKFCPSVLEAVGLRVPTRNIRNFSTLSCSSSYCPTAKCVPAANSVGRFVHIFNNLYLSWRNVV